MGKEILQKYTIFEVKRHLVEMEKRYGKERTSEMFGKEQAVQAPHSMQSYSPASSNGVSFFSCRLYAPMTAGMSMPAEHASLHLPQFVQALLLP